MTSRGCSATPPRHATTTAKYLRHRRHGRSQIQGSSKYRWVIFRPWGPYLPLIAPPGDGRSKWRAGHGLHGAKGKKVADLCSELGITRQTLYRRVAPDGALRKDGLKVVEGGKTGNQHRKKQGDRRCLPRFSVQLLLLRPLIRRSSACGSAYLSQFFRS